MSQSEPNGVNSHVEQAAESTYPTHLLRRTRGISYGYRYRHQNGVSSFGFVLASRQNGSRPDAGRTQFKNNQRSLFQFKDPRCALALRSNIAIAAKGKSPFIRQPSQKQMGTILELVHHAREQ